MERLLETIKRYLLYILCAYVLLDYALRNIGGGMMASIWDELLFILVIGTWTLLVALKGIRPRAVKLMLPLLCFYAAVFFIYLIKSHEAGYAMMELRSLIQYTFWVLVGLNLVQERREVKNLCDVFLLVGLVAALYGIYQYVAGVAIPSTWVDQAEAGVRSRAFSFVGSPNVLGSFLILHISIAFASFMAAQHPVKKRLYLIATGVSILCLVFTLSRGAWLVFLVAFILLSLWLDKRILIALIIMSLVTPLAVPSVYNRMAYMLSPQYITSSTEGGRIGRWTQALEYWRAEPETGLGLGNFGGGTAIAAYPRSAYSVDNFYLKIGTEMGLLGLAAFLYLLLAAIRLSRRALALTEDRYLRILGTGIFVGLLAILGHNLVENMFERPLMATYFWFFLGLLLALPGIKTSSPGGIDHG